MSRDPRELIVYACPVGALNDQILAYYAESRRRFGPNQAHRYMPHCTLTGFFHDDLASVDLYARALDHALARARTPQPDPVIDIADVVYTTSFHGFHLSSPWLEEIVADFAALAGSATRRDSLRLKRGLHLSLAYGFRPEHADGLAALACEMVDRTAQVSWELRFYERHPGDLWTSHASWQLD